MKSCHVAALLAAVLVLAGCSGKDVPRGANSQARHQAFEAMLPHYTEMVQMANGSKGYQAAEFARLVGEFEKEAQQPFAHFERDGGGMDGKAKAAVWDKPAEFSAAKQAFFQSIADVNAIAASGQLDKINTQVKAVDKQCMACHAVFRD